MNSFTDPFLLPVPPGTPSWQPLGGAALGPQCTSTPRPSASAPPQHPAPCAPPLHAPSRPAPPLTFALLPRRCIE